MSFDRSPLKYEPLPGIRSDLWQDKKIFLIDKTQLPRKTEDWVKYEDSYLLLRDKNDQLSLVYVANNQSQKVIKPLIDPSLQEDIYKVWEENIKISSQKPLQEQQMYFPNELCERTRNYINSEQGHTNGQYNLYLSEVEVAQYATDRGVPIGKRNANDEIDEELDQITKDEKLIMLAEANLIRPALRTIHDAKGRVEIAASIIAAINPHPDIDPETLARKAQKMVKRTLERAQQKNVIEPRTGLAFSLHGFIPRERMDHGRTVIEHELEQGRDPHRLAEAWIVSDIDPEEVLKKSGLSGLSGRTFLCMTEYDALELIKRIQLNRDECQRYLAAKTPVIHENINRYDQGEFIFKLRDLISKFDVNEVKAPGLRHALQEFEQASLIKQPYANNEINRSLAQLYEELKVYVREHPYKNIKTDMVFELFSKMEELNEKLQNAKKSTQSIDIRTTFKRTHETEKKHDEFESDSSTQKPKPSAPR